MKQLAVLEKMLRGKVTELTAKEAKSKYAIGNLRARMCEMKKAGLRVNSRIEKKEAHYSISARDVNGSRAVKFK